ncbi:IS5 family transposase [Nonomuraea angiospora]|uniref:IS5 family transposase n=1 Tax=Nonomuraea angiospora TaxID=46172 RepID=UPI00331F7290
MADAEWAVLEAEARAMMAELVVVTGRPMVHDLRAILDAIGYVTWYGIEWRALPVDFPPHEAVYAFFLRWSRRGLPERLAGRLRGRLRILAGRGELPTAGCLDSQTVRAAGTVGAAACGYDAGKKVKGQKRHVVVDTLGLLLCVIVTAASVQDCDAAHPVLALLREKFSTITLVWADGGYAGRLQSLGRPATASALVQPRPARQGPATVGRSALAGLEGKRTYRHPRDRERQQLPHPTVPMVSPGLHQPGDSQAQSASSILATRSMQKETPGCRPGVSLLPKPVQVSRAAPQHSPHRRGAVSTR